MIRRLTLLSLLSISLFLGILLTLELLGSQCVCILGDSMLPTYKSGNLVICIPSTEIATGDIICFEKEGTYIVHRVVAIDDSVAITKGDNNITNDAFTVTREDIVGVAQCSFPMVGYLAGVISLPIGRLLLAIMLISIYGLYKCSGKEREE